jgi:hypothetical protein
MTAGDGGLCERNALHARHAEDYPASLDAVDGWVVFGVRHPLQGGADRLAVAACPGNVLVTREPSYWPLGDVRRWRVGIHAADLITVLGMIGEGRGIGDMPKAPEGVAPVVALLAAELMGAWEAAGCLGDPEQAAFEALEREQARLDEAGLNRLLAALPKGIGRILDSRGGFSGDRTWNMGFLDHALAREGRSAAIAALGDLMDLVGTDDGDEDPTDHPDAASFVLESIARWPTEPLGGSGSPTRDHAEWLVERFSQVEASGDRASAIPVIDLMALVSHKGCIEDARLRGPGDAAGLVAIVRVMRDAGLSQPRLPRVLQVISMCGGGAGYGAIAAQLAEAGGRGAKAMAKGRDRLFLDAEGLRRSFRDAVLLPAVAARLTEAAGPPDPTFGWIGLEGAALARLSASCADEAVFGGRDVAEAAAAGLAWRQAGSPGQAEPPAAFWNDIAEFGGEAGERLLAAASGKVPHGDPTPFLVGAWRGDEGAARIAEAARAIAAGCIPAASAPATGGRDAGEGRRPGALRRLAVAFLGAGRTRQGTRRDQARNDRKG